MENIENSFSKKLKYVTFNWCTDVQIAITGFFDNTEEWSRSVTNTKGNNNFTGKSVCVQCKIKRIKYK